MKVSNLVQFEDYCIDRATEEHIKYTESKTGFKFPKMFKQIVRQCDGGSVVNTDFNYYNPYERKFQENGLGRFIYIAPEKKNSLAIKFLSPPEGFPKNVVAFGGNGGGDYICFDYRSDPTTDNPPIVLWLHEENEGEDVIFLANTFEEFLKMLKEPED